MEEGPSEPDILEQKSRPGLIRLPSAGRRPSREAGLLAAVTLAIGLAAGYAAGHRQGRGAAAAPGKAAASASQASPGVATGTVVTVAPPASTGFFGSLLTQNPGTCSVQDGRDLELGIPVTNQSAETILLQSARPVSLVSGLLKVLSWRWGPCGSDQDGIVPDNVALGPGDTTWVTAVVRPLAACPGPAPLQFRITYSINRQQSTFNLPGFPALGAVRYSRCPTWPPSAVAGLALPGAEARPDGVSGRPRPGPGPGNQLDRARPADRGNLPPTPHQI